MSKFVMKSVALAIGALVAGGAFAQVNLDAASPTPVRYAAERNVTAATNLAGIAQTATAAFGASLGTNVVAYARLDLGGATFNGAVDAGMFSVNATNSAATVAVAQSGTGFVIFAVTPPGGENLVGANIATIDTDTGTATGLTVTDKSGVTLRYRLFETLTAAANPSAINTLKDTGAVSYVTFSNAFSTAVTMATAVSDVASNPSYTRFLTTSGMPAGITTKALGTITGTLAGRLLPAGGNLLIADLLQDTNTVTAMGDFTALRNGDSTYTGAALGRVVLAAANDCSGAQINAATLNATTATFTLTALQAQTARTLCVTVAGTYEINPATYTLAAAYTAQTNFTVANAGAATSGTITRNGVRMVAPLVNQPPGWFSRLVMTNTGSSSRDYTIRYLTEAGTQIVANGLGAAGTLAAGMTTLIDLPSVITITPGAGLGVRASLVVTVNAPQSEIDGLYQIVSPTGSAVSNYILVYKN